jgi:hypothetical protein
MFVGLHVLLAERTHTPEIAISDEEGHAMQVAAQNVLRHYSVAASQKTLDWIALWACAGGVYGPRVVAVAVRRQSEAAQKKQPRGRVVRFPVATGEAHGPHDLPADNIDIRPDTDGTDPAA